MKPKCVGGSKKDLIFELSGSNNVGLILKILDICLLLAKNRQFPVLTGNAWVGLKSDIVSGLPYKIILSRCCYTSLAIMDVFRFTSGHPAPSKPGPFCTSTLYAMPLKKDLNLIMLSFSPICAKKSTHPKKPVFIVLLYSTREKT